MADTTTEPDTTDTTGDTAPNPFADITSDDVRPGETAAQARRRRATAKRKAAPKAPPKAKPAPKVKPAASTTTDTNDSPPTRGPGRPPGSGTKRAKRADGVTAVLGLIGTGVAIRNQADAVAIFNGAPALADALANLAETNRAMARTLDALIETTGYTEVAIAVAAIALPIMANHGFTLGLGGGPAPEPEPAAGPPVDGGFRVDGFGVPVVAPGVPPEYVNEPWNMPFTAS
jgi:hypothetical protein